MRGIWKGLEIQDSDFQITYCKQNFMSHLVQNSQYQNADRKIDSKSQTHEVSGEREDYIGNWMIEN